MAETPDFEAIARGVLASADDAPVSDAVAHPDDDWHQYYPSILVHHIAEQLRLIWNARGAADAKAMFETHDRMAVGDPLDQSRAIGLERTIDDHLVPALRSLDR